MVDAGWRAHRERTHYGRFRDGIGEDYPKDGCSLIERFLIITIEKRRFEPPKCVLFVLL
jgi:hypothetical protein